MYQIIFYKKEGKRSEIEDYLIQLKRGNDKSSKIKFNKIVAYIDMLSEYGLSIGEPYIKHLEDEIWELRPLRDRILFICLNYNKFILLNIFMKQTTKTPQKQIEKAKRYFEDYKNRSDEDGK